MSNNTQDHFFKWTSFPFLEKPLQSFFVIVLLILIAVFVQSFTSNVFWVLLSLAFMIGSLVSYFIPTTYCFYGDHVTVIMAGIIKRNHPYTEFRCFYADKQGVMLSTFSRPRRLDPFRGQSIRFSKAQTERKPVLDFLEEKIGNRY